MPMNWHRCWHRWLCGWAVLARHEEVYAGRHPGVLRRLHLELMVALGAWRGRGFWRAVAIGLVLLLLVQIFIWRCDLHGRWRDVLQCLPVLLVTPWVAAARARRLGRLLERQQAPVGSSVTDSSTRTLQIAPPGLVERRSCQGIHTVMPPRPPGGASAGWTSFWRSVVSACWQRLRSRGSRH